MTNYEISSPEEAALRKDLEQKTDAYSMRLKRYLSMPDLSRMPGSPLAQIIALVKEAPSLKNFDDIKIPEIIPGNSADQSSVRFIQYAPGSSGAE